MKELVDLEELKRAAENADGEVAIVERTWLAQALEEITLGRAFGLKPGERL